MGNTAVLMGWIWALSGQVADTDAYHHFPEPPMEIDAPVYPGGSAVECAIAVALARHVGAKEAEPFDPVLRDDKNGDLDCEATFASEGIRTKQYTGTGTHLALTRPLLAPDGAALIWKDFQGRDSRSAMGYVIRNENDVWVVGESFAGFVT